MRLRVIDFGYVSALRSQAVYHGLAETMTEDSDPILSLVSPADPYVCVGIHQDIAHEVDTEFCTANNLPIYRRHVGGGAVYLDENQLFTHFIYPQGKAPEFATNLYPLFIEPVVRTYQEMGINAVYRPINDIQVDGRKIGGTGAASIADATVMVGSFMIDFDVATMSKCLKVPSEKFRDKVRQTMEDYMTTIIKLTGAQPDRADLKARFLGHCADVLGVTPEYSELTKAELAAIDRAEAQLADPEWTDVQKRKLVALGVKVSADTHVTEAAHKAPGGMIKVSLVDHEGTLEDVVISGDFTCLPPDGVDRLAAKLRGAKLTQDELAEAAHKAIEALGIELPGVAADDIATAVMAAVQPA